MLARDFAVLLLVCLVSASNFVIAKLVLADLHIPPLFFSAVRLAIVLIAVCPWPFPVPRPLGRTIVVGVLMGAGSFGPETGETIAGFNDLDDFDGQVFNPPLDATRGRLNNFPRYSQVVTVMPVDENQPSINTNESAPAIPKNAYTGAVRVRVRILYAQPDGLGGKEVYRSQWVRMDRE